MSEKGDFAAPSDVIKCEGLLKDVCDNRDLRAPFFSPETTYEIPLQVQHKHKESEITESETYTFSGRYITIVVNTSPLEVKKCFVKPKIISKLGLDLLAEQMLRKICGRNNLRDVMLLVTPVNDSSITDRYKMHCFDLSTKRHLGVTSMTSRERELIENYHSPKNFILLFSTRNIDLQDLVKNSSIKMEIFGTAKKRSTTVTRVLYQGTAVDVCVQSCKKVRVGVSLDCKSFDNKTLKKPKIRVHSNQHLVSDSIDYTGLYKSYGQKHCTTSNLAQCRRLDYPGFGRRALKLIVHHRQRTYSIGSVEQCLNLKAKLLESQKKNVNLDNKSETKLKEVGYDSNSVRNVKKTDLSTEKRKIFLEKAKKPEEKPNAIKMTLEMARKMRAQCDRQKAHIAGERLRKRNDLVRQTVDCFKNVELEIRDIAKSTSLETNIAKMNATSKDKTTSSRPLIFKNYLKAAPTTKSISKDSAKDQSSSSGRETYLKAVETPTTQPISKDQSTSREAYIAEINENEKDQTSSGLLVRETYSKEVETPSNKSIFTSALSSYRTIYSEDIAIDCPTLQNIPESTDYTSMMDSQPDNTTFNKQIYEDNIVEESIGVNNYLTARVSALENILVSSDSTSTTDSEPDDNTTIMQIYQGNTVDESIGINKNLSISGKIAFLKGELSTLELKRSFSLFGRLIEGINLKSCPLDEHLILFFKFADLLSFKMFVRKEYNWPKCSPTNEPRCRIECFAFDDDKNYITSIGLLTRQLKMLMDLYPNVLSNMQYINDAFSLTTMPRTLTICLKSLLHKNIYNLLAELTYEWVQEPCSVLKIARQLELEELRDQQEHQSLIEFIKNS